MVFGLVWWCFVGLLFGLVLSGWIVAWFPGVVFGGCGRWVCGFLISGFLGFGFAFCVAFLVGLV